MDKKTISVIKNIICLIILAAVLWIELYLMMLLLISPPYVCWDTLTTIINEEALAVMRLCGIGILTVNTVFVPIIIKKHKIFSCAYLVLTVISFIRLIYLFSIG